MFQKKELIKKTRALLLAMMLTLSMPGLVFYDALAYAETTEEPQQQEQLIDNEEGENVGSEKTEEAAAAVAAEGTEDAEEIPAEVSEQGDNPEQQQYIHLTATSEESEGIENGHKVWSNSIKLTWDAVEGASSYTVSVEESSLNDDNLKFSRDTVEVAAEESVTPEAVFTGLFPSRKYSFTVTAYSGSGEAKTQLMTTQEPFVTQPVIQPLNGRVRGSTTVNPGKLTFANGSDDLRTYAGQKYNEYAVAQGGATDGVYAYILLVRSSNQYGRVAKVRMSDNALVAVSEVLPTTHGNGMTYDSRRNRLIVIGRDDTDTGRYKRQEITVIDANSMTVIQQKNADYSNYSGSSYFDGSQQDKGLGAISYSPKYDVYLAKQRDNNNLIAIDPDTLKAVGLIKTLVNQYGGAGQAMDGDDQFVYMLKSGYGSSNTNIILTLDWNGDVLIGDNGYRKAFVNGYWACKNDKYPVAVYTINTPFEAENVFHIYDGYGQHFYMTEYNANQQYTVTTQKKAYKVKWKKVKKKVKVKKKYKKKVKWKKKKNGKWKYKKVTAYKYVWKKKKVWVYKTKYKNVKVSTPTYKERRDYIYDLGVLP